MRREMDLIREILLALENDQKVGDEALIEGYTGAQVNYHAGLLMEAGLAEGIDISHMKSEYRTFVLRRLTWKGHEFLDAARDKGRWENAKKRLADVGGFSLPVMQQLLTAMLKEQVGIGT